MAAAVNLDLPVSPEREDRRETAALRGCLYLDPQDDLELLEAQDHRGPLDLQAFPALETASQGNPGSPVHREREATPETRDRKVKRVKPA